MTKSPDGVAVQGARLAAILLAGLSLGGTIRGTGAPPQPTGNTLRTTNLASHATSLAADSLAEARRPHNRKLDTSMATVLGAAQRSMEEALEMAQAQAVRLSGRQMHVQIVVRAQGAERVAHLVTRAGGQITGIGNDHSLLQGWLPIDALEAVSGFQDVLRIRRPAEVVLFAPSRVGSSTTEGLTVMNGTAWHSAGYTGSGVKVGVIDGGFEGYESLLGGDLPASVTVRNFVDAENDSQVDGTTEHGTACAEIIHDIAPDASLYLAKVGTNLDLQEAVSWLRDTHDVDIISTSLGWYNVTPGDGTGEFADLVEDARNDGILWVTAAGNDREVHWGGLYSDGDGDGVHNFEGSQEVNYFGPGDDQAYYIDPGYKFRVFLRWSDWTSVSADYDLYLLRYNGSSWDVIASSEDVQDGGLAQTPTESAVATTSGDAAPYGYAIRRHSGSEDVNFEVFTPKFLRLDEILRARSLVNLADAPDAMTVAALDAASPYPQERYSSEGPTNGPGGVRSGGFNKPDVSGFANVATESYTGSSFNGTSAATPHVAGAAAVVLSAYPDYEPDQLQAFLEARAVDKGHPGLDTVYGNGRLYLGDLPGQVNVRINKSVVGGDFLPGDSITFTLDIANTGSVTATNVVVTDNLPSEVLSPTYASPILTPPTGTLSYPQVWDIGLLEPGGRGAITIYGQVDPDLDSGFSFVNVATISDPEDETLTDDTDSVSVGWREVYLPLVTRETTS